jgi:hypothetical protein
MNTAVAEKNANNCIDTRFALLINKAAKKFFQDPENMKKYETWHLEQYGCLPKKGAKK